jgi:hypothetical protein
MLDSQLNFLSSDANVSNYQFFLNLKLKFKIWPYSSDIYRSINPIQLIPFALDSYLNYLSSSMAVKNS